MLGLRFFASTKGGVEGDAIEAVVFVTLVGCREVVDAGNFAESGEEIIESKLMVADTTGGYLTRPTHNEGNADSPFVGGALDAAQQAVAIEEGRVGTALFVRAIVGGEDDHRVFIQPFGFETVEDFADHHIQARDHGGKLGVSFEGGVVARVGVGIGAFGAEHPAIGRHETVVRLRQFGVGQGVGEDAQERLSTFLTVEPFEGFLMDEVGAVLSALEVVVGTGHSVPDVLLEHHAMGLGVAGRTAESVEEVGVVGVSLVLADVAVVFIDATLIGSGI